MKFVCLRKFTQAILCTLLILSLHNQLFSQSDSARYWQNEITKCSSPIAAKTISEKIRRFVLRNNKQFLIVDANVLLRAASKSEYSKQLFYEILYAFENAAKDQKLETEFALFVIRLESNKNFSNANVKNQLYYYYTILYYRLKEYYYSSKYCDLFLKNRQNTFTAEAQTNIELNAMTISAFIDLKKNDFEGALKKFKIVLDSSIAKKSIPWIGITKGNIGDIFYRREKYDDAIPYLKEDIKISMASKELGSALNSYIELKNIYIKLNKIEKANLYLDSAYYLLKQIITSNPLNENEYLDESFELHTSLAKRFYNNKDYTNASIFYSKAFEIHDKKEKNDNENQIKKIIQKIEIDRNINQINELHEEIKDEKIELLYFGVIAICIFSILIVIIFFYRKLKRANKSLTGKNTIINNQNLALEKTNNDKDILFSIISHDLSGPSRNLQLIFKAVADKKLPFSSLENQIPNILKNTTNLVNTLESLLNWSASQLKGIKVNKVLIDANDSVEKNIHFFEDLAHKKNITLINNCHPTMVFIDKHHIEIILRNFTSNAIKFSTQNSTIQFNLIDFGDYVEIFVIDEGTGLTEVQIDNILNNIAMKSAVGTLGEKGIGLGLLLTKEFIEINGGRLYVKSDHNHGTSMSFTIPKYHD